MKVSLPVTCHLCGEAASQSIRIDETSFDWSCSKCGYAHSVFLSLDLTIGFLLLERSRAELEEKKDYTMAITMAAAAFEMELSRLYIKWTHIADLRAEKSFDKLMCETALKKLKFIPKLNTVADMLYPTGLEGFVESSPENKEAIVQRFPSLNLGSLAADFHKTVFKPRNAIMHQGDLNYTEQDAKRVLSIVSLGLNIFLAMDLERRKLL